MGRPSQLQQQQPYNIPTSLPRPSRRPTLSVSDQNGMNMLYGLGLLIGGGVLIIILFTAYRNWKAKQEEKNAEKNATSDSDKKHAKFKSKVANGGVPPVKSTPMPQYNTLSSSGGSTASSSIAPSPVPKAMPK